MIKSLIISKAELGTTEPISLSQVKEHLNIELTDTDNDSKLNSLITRCRRMVENYCNISITLKRITVSGYFKGDCMLPYGPVQSIEGVFGIETSLGSGIPNYSAVQTGWWTEGDTFFGCLEKRVRVVYTAGMETVPDDLILGMLNEIAYRYQHLGDEENKTLTWEAKQILQPFMILWL